MKRHCVFHSAALAGALMSSLAAAVPQAFVASTGSDANTRRDCTVDRPCRTFAAALSVADNGGEIVALDGADYGVVAITKSISIIGAAYAGISVPAGSDGVTIATPGVNVVLRGLNIHAKGGQSGVVMTDGASLAVENCAISNFAFHGVSVNTPAKVRIVNSVLSGNSNGAAIAGGASADVIKSQFMKNAGAGLSVGASGATTSASVSDSTASGNLHGFLAFSDTGAVSRMSVTRSTAANNGFAGFSVTANAVMTVGNSMASGNGIGLANVPAVSGFGTLETLGNNTVRQNGSPTLGIITSVSGM